MLGQASGTRYFKCVCKSVSCQWVYGGKNQDKVIKCESPASTANANTTENTSVDSVISAERQKRLELKSEKAEQKRAKVAARLGWNVTEFPEQPKLESAKYRIGGFGAEGIIDDVESEDVDEIEFSENHRFGDNSVQQDVEVDTTVFTGWFCKT